jgi:hypothetical protein
MSKPTKQNSLLIFIETVLGVKLTRHQRRIVQAVLQHRRVAVASCHAIGKSFVLAALAIAWAAIHPDARVLIIVPGWLMARSVIFSEIHALLERAKHQLPIVSSTQTEIRFGAKNFIMGLSTADAGRLQGHHSGHLLVIVDEAAAIDPAFWPAIEGTLAGGDSRLIIAGNPVVVVGPFAEAFGKARANWECIQIGAFDTDNFRGIDLPALLAMSDEELDSNERPYLITRRWTFERHKEWWNGDISNSPLWASRVLGLFPSEGSTSVFPLAALEAARRKAVDPGGPVVVGVDPAGPGRDLTACVAVAGGAILELTTYSDADARGRVVEFIKRWSDRVQVVRIDSGGLGWYLMEHVRSQGFRTVGLNAASAPNDRERYTNLKAERYFNLRQAFIKGAISGLDDDAFGELAAIAYLVDPRGKIAIEDKASVRSALGHSPDRAEALMLALGESNVPIDHAFQMRAAQTFAAATAARRRGFDAVSSDLGREYARQPDFSRAEDREQAMAKFSNRTKWAGY